MKSEFLKNGTILSVNSEYLLLGWGKRVWLKEPKSGPEPSFYFPDFFLKIESPWFVHKYYALILREELNWLAVGKTSSFQWESSTKESFSSTFFDLQMRFQKGELQKAVPYIFEHCSKKMAPTLLSYMLKQVLDYGANHSVHVYGMWNEEEGVLGATPEILFDYSTTLKTVACAGTFSPGSQTFSKKLLHEHALVITGIKEALNPFGTVRVGAQSHCEFGSLGHLITPIELYPLHTLEYMKIVKALHPTPALGAYPKDQGMLWLEKYQMQLPRDRFGAPAGFLHQGNGRCLVGIRNIQWDHRGMRIGAGCGIVPESLCEEEWHELQLKLQAIKGIIGC